ncbi:MAG: hypothetical protein CME33_19635 [Gimesia sp.]|uniref:tetratricopeptide repeat protein n=1 Tax=Gimesia sp. TaxID=2024833 RepID=UPI000C3B2AD6|nr:tetratricopeptide repeat protein [Gimesia sp.]MAX38775.1 hypothetical protein [Gimesia sp.]|tara:strand:- start:786 stop:1232 length:447 start_codon:yes stop_codon:yes gene_type:complete
MAQGKRQEMVASTAGVFSFVAFCLIMLCGCHEDKKAVPAPKSDSISNKSEKVKQAERQEFERCRKAAELGDAVEQNNLGLMYSHGEGVEQDNTLAVVWFRKSAEQGNAVAQFNLGIMYLNGEGVKQDDTQGYEWLNKSYRQLKKQNKL